MEKCNGSEMDSRVSTEHGPDPNISAQHGQKFSCRDFGPPRDIVFQRPSPRPFLHVASPLCIFLHGRP